MPSAKGTDVINALNHEIRRKILMLLESTPKTYSQLLETFDIATGKLNYHLKLLEGLIDKNKEGMYKLTALGEKALSILKELVKESGELVPVTAPDGNGEQKFDEKALKLLEYIRQKLDAEQPEPRPNYLIQNPRKRAIMVLLLMGVVLPFVGFSLLAPEGEPPGDAPVASAIWILGTIVIIFISTVLLKMKVLKKRKKASFQE
nr:winged helix-turn-helix domain-containing protein [Candidatus Sigynarchaeota archaeon]